MRPVIGVTTETDATVLTARKQVRLSNAVPVPYLEALEAAGGLPLLIPSGVAPEHAADYLRLLDGLLLSGGEDMDPAYFGEEPRKDLGAIDVARDRMEWELTRLVLEMDLPVLGICRGIQVLNVAAGGTLHQDIGRQAAFSIKHRQDAPGDFPTHRVRIAPGSRLAAIWQAETVRTNSFHHQAVREPAPGFQAVAWSEDGVVEAIEAEAKGFALGVQCHPELMWRSHDPSRRLFEAFIEAAQHPLSPASDGRRVAVAVAPAIGHRAPEPSDAEPG